MRRKKIGGIKGVLMRKDLLVTNTEIAVVARVVSKPHRKERENYEKEMIRTT